MSTHGPSSSIPAWTGAPATPDEFKAQAGTGYQVVSDQIGAQLSGAPYARETMTVSSSTYDTNFAASVTYVRNADTHGNYGAWTIVNQQRTVETLPNDINKIKADPQLNAEYNQILKNFAQTSMLNFVQQQNEHAKTAFKSSGDEE
jgi:hypothetical protein